MPYFILAIALASILLIGCEPLSGTFEQRQKRAENALSTATEAVKDTATKIGKHAEELGEGVEDINGRVKKGRRVINSIEDVINDEASSAAEN